MMTDDTLLYIYERVFPAAFALLPGRMNTQRAHAMLLTIGLQESRFKYRRQLGDGPARGFWQFEKMGGVRGVLQHKLSSPIIKPICSLLQYSPVPLVCHTAIEHNDVLACVFARLLLYTDPAELPQEFEDKKAWSQYLANWRPGKPAPSTWDKFYQESWRVVTGA